MSRGRDETEDDDMNVRKRKLMPVLVEAGVSAEQVEQWDGELFALYRISGGTSATYAVAAEISRENERVQNWAVDLGGYATTVPRAAAERLERFCIEQGVAFDRHPLAQEYVRRSTER